MDYYMTTEYQLNTFGLFLEKSHNLLKIDGFLGMIIPNYWLSTRYDKKLRQFLFHKNSVIELLNVYNVFATATVDTLILLSTVPKKQSFPKTVNVKSIDRHFKTINERLLAVKAENWTYSSSYLISSAQDDISISFSKSFQLNADDCLDKYFIFKKGMQPYEKGKGKPEQTREMMDNRIYHSKEKKDKSYLPLLQARNIKRYYFLWDNDWIKYGENLAASRDPDIFKGPRILVQRIISSQRIIATYTDQDFICNTDVITLKPTNENNLDILFFLGIISSRTIAMYLKCKNVNLDRAAFPKINVETLSFLPVPRISHKNISHHDKMVQLVTSMLDLQKRRLLSRTDHEKNLLQRQIELTDRRIDEIVYELYGLTKEEINIIEGDPK
jgi:adenine-specific DNA-methyltransferase